MKYQKGVLASLLLYSALGLTAQEPVVPPPKLVSATPKPPPAQPTPNSSRPKPSAQLLGQKWPVPKEAVDGTTTIEARTEELRRKFEKAQSLLVEKKAAEALAILLEVEKAEPDRSEVQQLIAVAYSMTGRAEEAVRTFQRAVKLAPRDAAARFGLCQSLAYVSRTLEAIDECREAVRLAPNRQAIKLSLAELYIRADLAREASILLESNATQNDIVSMGLLGDTYFISGEYLRAAEIYEQIAVRWPAAMVVHFRLSQVYDYLDRPTDSIAAARKLVELEPKLIESHLHLGERLHHSGFFHEAIEALKKASAIDPSSGASALLLADNYTILGDQENALANLRLAYRVMPRTAQLATRFGFALADNASEAESIEPLEFANRNDPNRPDIMRQLGLAYISAGRYDEGKALIDRANQISPLPPGITMTFPSSAEVNRRLERFDETLAFVEKNPKHFDGRRYLVGLYRLKKMNVEAEKHYLEMVKLRPDDFAIYNDLAVFYADLRQDEKSVEAVRNAIRLKPHHVLYMTLSSGLRRLGRLDEAIEAAARAVEIKPDSVESRMTYAELLQKKGLRSDALREYQATFQIASGDPRPNFRLAWLYIQMGNRDGAFRHYAILKGVAPNDLKWLELCLKAHFGTLPR